MKPKPKPKTEKPESVDEKVADRLVQWDQALAEGEVPSSSEEEGNDDLSFLRYLRRHWPTRQGGHVTDATQGDETVATGGAVPEGPRVVPQSLGRFTMLRELGRGGFGVVFLAHDPKLGRHVALKIPAGHVMNDPNMRRRFQQEARAAAALDHPNIVPVFEAGEEEAVCYIVSAYCPGTSLAEWLRWRSEPVPFSDAAFLMRALAEAAQHAHERGVLHRDLKPANVMLSQRDANLAETEADASSAGGELVSLQARITDFGLARLESGDPATLTGAVLGTPNYMAPEQASGSIHQLGPATDVYALGAILYELVTGRPPFQGESTIEILLHARTSEPVPPTRIRPKTPRDLETICLKCLEKDPRGRYASAGDLARDLDRWRNNEPISARPVGRMGRTWRWARRNPMVAGLSASLAVLCIVSFVAVTWLWLEAADQAHRASIEKDRAQQSYGLARDALMTSVEKVVEDPRIKTGQLEDLRRVVQQIEADFYRQFVELQGDEPAFQLERARALAALARVTAQLGEVAEAGEYLRQAMDGAQQLVRDHPRHVAYRRQLCTVTWQMAEHLIHDGKLDEAEQYSIRNVAQLDQLAAEHADKTEYELDRWRNYSNVGLISYFRLCNARERPDEERQPLADAARKAFDQAGRMLTRSPNAHSYTSRYSVAYTYAHLAMVHYELAEWEPAERMVRVAVERLHEALRARPDSEDARARLANAHNLLAVIYSKTGRFEDEKQELLKAIEVATPLYEDHPLVSGHAIVLGNLQSNFGVWLLDGGQSADSLEWFDKAMVTLEPVRQRSPNNVTVREFLRNAHKGKATALTNLARHAEALVNWEGALEADSGQYRNWFSFQKARTLARLDRVDEAVSIAAACIDAPNPRAQMLFDAACVYALAAAHSAEPDRRDEFCRHAMDLLGRALDAEFDKVEKLGDADLDILRERPEFAELLARTRQ